MSPLMSEFASFVFIQKNQVEAEHDGSAGTSERDVFSLSSNLHVTSSF